MRTCKKCGVSKPLECYYKSITGACKECWRARVKAYRLTNLERIQAYDRERGQLLHRKEGVKERAARYKHRDRERIQKFRANHPEKARAHSKTMNAIRAGILKPKPCQRCGFAFGIQAHHEDYSKPLEVIWLCIKCHGERHREINEERRRRAA